MLTNLLEKINIDDGYIVFLNELDQLDNKVYFSNSLTSAFALPPALIPTKDFDGSHIDKHIIVKHWFIKREINYTVMYGEWKTYLEEARTFETFITKFFLDFLTFKEKFSKDIEDFAQKINYTRLDEIYDFYQKYGDNPNKITKLKYFNKLSVSLPNIIPMEYINSINIYTGDFATSSKGFVNVNGVDTATTFEIQDTAKPIVNRLKNLPEWLKKDANQKYLFDKYIENNELDKAWLTLNSTGWKLVNVADALELLTTKTDEEGFHLMVENWMQNWKNSYSYNDILEY